MDETSGKDGELRFDPGQIGIAEVRRLAADLWSDLAFDDAALARLTRDGLALRGVRLTGPIPYLIDSADDGGLVIRIVDGIDDPAHVAMLLDLWRLHFVKRFRPGSLAA
jgi:hypothetical protein